MTKKSKKLKLVPVGDKPKGKEYIMTGMIPRISDDALKTDKYSLGSKYEYYKVEDDEEGDDCVFEVMGRELLDLDSDLRFFIAKTENDRYYGCYEFNTGMILSENICQESMADTAQVSTLMINHYCRNKKAKAKFNKRFPADMWDDGALNEKTTIK